MKHVFESFPIALRMIFKDPINLMLSLIPTLIALSIYIFSVVSIYHNSDRLVSTFRGYVYTSDHASILGKILTFILIIFLFFLMSWTFVLVVGIISAPFNSLLSSRVEKKLGKTPLTADGKIALEQMSTGILQVFKNELKKIIFIVFIAAFAFVLNLFPLFYPVGIFLVAVLLSVQFIDYSWSRYNLHFGHCLKDVLRNIIPYSVAGFIFLMLVSIPIVNAFMPAYATSYFTVLWLKRQKKLTPML